MTGNVVEGFIYLHRKTLEWEWWDDHNTSRLWITILLLANHKKKKWRGIDVQKGQFITSIDKLAKASGLTSQKVRTSLDKLKTTNEITSHATNYYTIITVANFDSYQTNNKPDNKRITNEQQTDNKRVTTTNNDNNDNNDKNILGDKSPASNKPKSSKRMTNIKTELGDPPEIPQEWKDICINDFGFDSAEGATQWNKFKDYNLANNKRYADWKAAWRNWLRNAQKWEK